MRVKNTSEFPRIFPDLGLELEAGEQADVDDEHAELVDACADLERVTTSKPRREKE